MGSTQFYQRAPSNLPVDASGSTTQAGNSTVGGTLAVAGAATLGAGVGVTGTAAVSQYVNSPQFRLGTLPNGANGVCVAASSNNLYGGAVSYIGGGGAFSGTVAYWNYNRSARNISAASGSVVTNYDNGGTINVNTNGTATIGLPAVYAAALTNGVLGMEVTLAASTANTAITLTLGNAADYFLVPGSPPGTAGTGTLSCAAGSFASVTLCCIAANIWLARTTGTWTKT